MGYIYNLFSRSGNGNTYVVRMPAAAVGLSLGTQDMSISGPEIPIIPKKSGIRW